MITRYKYKASQPYGLHDMEVNNISFIDNETVQLQFEEGYVKLEEPYQKVKGNITIEKVDPDFSNVVLLSKDGKFGKFTGNKMELKEFLEKYDDYTFEIVDELYGFNRVEYSGFLKPKKGKWIEMTMFIYHSGDIVYETEE
ncbi:MAG: hypothetical protein K6G88_01955 [Lachnospiraceae bacterium]|nr:hypothetical protein [Lachnospiraceae bacterium]